MQKPESVLILPSRDDNYIYLVVNGTDAVAVDPGDARPVLQRCSEEQLTLRAVLLTHHHGDHTAGAGELRAATGCALVGPKDRRMPRLDRTVSDGEDLEAGPSSFRVMSTPGHTATHCVYYHEESASLFTGDTLFRAGCGRLFEGTAQEMWNSLQRLMTLPDATSVCCGHEYTEENLRFALSVEPENASLLHQLAEVSATLAAGQPTVPSTIALEKRFNPFVRASLPEIRAVLEMEQAPDHEVFGELRRRKNTF